MTAPVAAYTAAAINATTYTNAAIEKAASACEKEAEAYNDTLARAMWPSTADSRCS